VVRGRQSTMYRAQRLAEYALFDGDPTLFDSELDQYLAITPEQIRSAVERYLDVENRVVLDIVPATAAADVAADETMEPEPAASPQPPGEPAQPAAPPPQVPATPAAETPADVVIAGSSGSGQMENRSSQIHPDKSNAPSDF